MRNLEALLRSPTVAHRTILDLTPELRSGADVLRGAFEAALSGDAAMSAVAVYGNGRVEELSRLLDASAEPGEDRGGLAARAHTLADELEASADLLALLERASAPVRTDVSVGLIVRETSRTSGSASGRELGVRFEDASHDCVVTTDPYVLGSLVVLSVGWAHAAGFAGITVRARCAPSNAIVIVEESGAADQALPVISMRVLPCVPPAEEAARRVAAQIQATLQIEPSPPAPARRWWIRMAATSI